MEYVVREIVDQTMGAPSRDYLFIIFFSIGAGDNWRSEIPNVLYATVSLK